jgi:hypothetical protein
MERRQAVWVSLVGAGLLVAVAVLAIALVQMNGSGLPDDPVSFDAASAAGVEATTTTTAPEAVTVVEDVYEFLPSANAAPQALASGDASPGGSDPVPLNPIPGAAAATPSTARTLAPPISPAIDPTTTTTTRPVPVTTRPPEVPEDWPAGKPLPPIPPGCREPHLEDNGVWNCQH